MHTRTYALSWPLLVIAAVALAGCGGSSSGGGSPVAAGGDTTTVKVRTTTAGQVLTDSAGRTLYVSDQENGKVLCASSACNAIWDPLTVANGAGPQGPQPVAGDLTTVKRPDGRSQVAFNGKPLYTFSFDHAAGQVGGEGQRDSFDGTSFTWHAATVGAAVQPTSTPTSSSEYHY